MFFEVAFPTAVSFGAAGGPAFSTIVNKGLSGFEQRNRNWAFALQKWEILLNHKPKSYFDQVYAFFLAVGGMADAFRFKDHKDFSATAAFIGYGDGSTKAFQLQKQYTIGGRTYTRTVKKPITSAVQDFQGNALADTVKMYVGGVPKTLGADYTVDHTTGLVTFASAPALTSPATVITADFQFHFPARFDSDDMKAQVEESNPAGGGSNLLISWPAVQIVEVRL